MAFYYRSDSYPVARRHPAAFLAKTPLNRFAYSKQFSLEESKTFSLSEKEQGVLEKLCGSYGFIESCERQARFFFHFTQYYGDPDELTAGDPVEFEEVLDKRQKRPIAIRVRSIKATELAFDLVGDMKLVGRVDCLPRKNIPKSTTALLERLKPTRWSPNEGRISCEYKGECFFLSFSNDGMADKSVDLSVGDEVAFFVSTHKRTGITRAVSVTLEKRAEEQKTEEDRNVQGIVASLKDSFGFIERADETSEIFFHYTECEEGFDSLSFGDEVAFVIQDRHGKSVATQIKKLPPGTVQLDDISQRLFYGEIQDMDGPPKSEKDARNRPFGTVKEDGAGWEAEVYKFYQRDLAALYTLYTGDTVTFRVATDKRNGAERATEVALHEFVDKDSREMGVVSSIKDGFGFISCATRDASIFFHFCEVLKPDHEVSKGDEVEYSNWTGAKDGQKERAVRVKILPKGTVQFEVMSDERYEGRVANWRQGGCTTERNRRRAGEIECILDGKTELLTFTDEDMTDIRATIDIGDPVEFNVFMSKRKEGKKRAGNVEKLIVAAKDVSLNRGYVTVLKDHYGFIEFEDHGGEVFFNYGASCSDPCEFNLGCEVQFLVNQRGGKTFAGEVTLLDKGTLQNPIVEPTILEGAVAKQLRDTQSGVPYSGLIACNDDDEEIEVEFGVSSVVDPRTYLQLGDKVAFQMGVCCLTGKKRAYNVERKLERYTGKVEMYQSGRQFGFISCSEFENGNLFFHANEIRGGNDVHVGDLVEFSIGHGFKAKKECAIDLKILNSRSPSPRKSTGERTVEKRKFFATGAKLRVTVIRQPTGPDGTRGFTLQRKLTANVFSNQN
eukprot:m.14812 g.14812  ORF g.14812 m.14812 type:complete len:840 (+) comp25984_c0_seq2:359-2878(+)